MSLSHKTFYTLLLPCSQFLNGFKIHFGFSEWPVLNLFDVYLHSVECKNSGLSRETTLIFRVTVSTTCMESKNGHASL